MAGGGLSHIYAHREPTFVVGSGLDIILMEDTFMRRGFVNQHGCIINQNFPFNLLKLDNLKAKPHTAEQLLVSSTRS